MEKKLIVITGASSGIGEATAKKFSAMGHPVLLLARRIEKLEALKLPNSLCIKLDVRNLEDFKKAVATAEAKYGKTDLLVNNAGVLFTGMSPQESQETFDINIMGVLNGMNVVLADMQARKGGTIVNIASVVGHKAYPGAAAYTASKYAVAGLTEATRQEVAAHNVRIIDISPGATLTDMVKTAGVSVGVEVEDVANSIAFVYSQPQSVTIRNLTIAPTSSAF